MLRLALLVSVAATLNGSVALAVSPPACDLPAATVCALPLDADLRPASLNRTEDALARVGLFEADTPFAGFAPPARPADLLARHRLAAAAPAVETPEDERPLASYAPPARPAHLGRSHAPEL